MTRDAIRVESKERAWAVADTLFECDYQEDEPASENAGYPIFRGNNGKNCWISDLGCRLELNFSNGDTINIWIGEAKFTAAEVRTVVKRARKELEDIEQIAEFVGHMEVSLTSNMVLRKLKDHEQQLHAELAMFGLEN